MKPQAFVTVSYIYIEEFFGLHFSGYLPCTNRCLNAALLQRRPRVCGCYSGNEPPDGRRGL